MRKILLFWLFSLVFSYSINAQSASTYSFAASTGTYTQVNDATATRLNLVEADSYLSTAQSIGFNFVYEGITYTQFKMGSNGFISLNSSGTAILTTNNFSTANSTSRPIIAPLWDDLDGRSTGSVSAAYFEVTGSAPNRVLTVEWRNWEWNYASSTPVISFQAKLYETTNIIEFVYRSETGTPSSGSASIGIGSATGSGNNSYLNLTSTTTPAVSSISSVTTLSTKPATGQVYTFTPPTPCSGAPLAGTVSGPASACSGIGFNITATGYSTGVSGMTYRWQTATSATGPWTNTTGTSPASFTATQTSTAFYRLVDTCTNSGIGAESNVISVTIGNASYSSLPFFESFENIWIDGCNTKDIPTNNWRNSPATTDSSWRRDDDAASGGNTAIWGSTTSYMYTPASSNGSRSARFHSGNITAGRRGIFDLYIDCSSGVATKQLSFDYINTSGTDSLVISMSTDGGVSFARLDSITLRTAWTNKLVNFTSTSSTTILRFTATADFGSTDIGLDNVNVVVLNTCSGTPTTGIISSNSTTVCAGSSVSFSSSTYTIATGMTYRWQTSATGSDPWTNTTTTSASSYSFTFSTPVWVRRVDTCTNTGQFAISNAVQISINAATYASLPFTESFEATWIDGCGATGSQSIPNVNWRNTPVTGNNSWRRNDETTTNSGWSSTSGAYSPTFSAGAYSARIHTYSTSTPGSLDLYLDCNSGAATKQLSYDYINTSGSDSLKVFLSIDGGSTFNFIGTKNTTTTTWSNFIIPFTSSSATTVIRFTAYGDFGSTDIGLDNLNVLILNNCSGTPSAGTINGPSSSPCLGSSVTLTASGYTNGVIGLTYRWQSSTDNINWVNTIGTNPASFTTIVNGNIWFRLVDTCTNSNQFAVSNVINVNTQTAYTTPWSENFDAMTTLGAGILPSCWLNVTGTNAFTSANAASNTYNDPLSAPNYVTVYYPYTTGSYLWTPAFQLTAGTSYDFSFYFAGDATAGWVGDVFYNTSQSATGATALGASFVTALTTTVKTYNQVTRTFTPTSSGVYYFGIKAFASTSAPYYMGFDDFKLDLTPSCVIPSALSSSNVTATTATINWTAPTIGTTPTGYEYVVSTTNTAPSGSGTSEATTTANLTSLTANTTYYVFVRTNCGGGSFSAWTSSVSFTTQCQTGNIPLTQDFEAASTIPTCWSTQYVTGSKDFSVGSTTSAAGTSPNPAAYGGTNRLLFASYSGNGKQTRLVSEPLTSAGLSNVSLEYYWYHSVIGGATSYTTEGVQVQWSTDGTTWTNIGQFIPRYNATEAWTLKSLNLPVGATNQAKLIIGFLFTSNAGYDCYLDDISIKQVALPVTITKFAGVKQANQNLLTWTTASEQNNKGFELQRSADGVNYSTLTFVNSKAINGNSNTTLDYTFTDTKPFVGNSYYRLKQLDKDGKESLSQVVLLKGTKGTQLDITSIYPNPTTSQLNVIMSAPSRDKVTIVITDVAGKVLVQKIVNVISGDNGIQLDVSKLASGTYIMKAICENGCDSGSKKFMKQ